MTMSNICQCTSHRQPQGLVDIFTAYNLVRVRRVKGAHSTFITGSHSRSPYLLSSTLGLEFLPTGEEGSACRGLQEASLISISVDHQVGTSCSFIAALREAAI